MQKKRGQDLSNYPYDVSIVQRTKSQLNTNVKGNYDYFYLSEIISNSLIFFKRKKTLRLV